MTVVNGFAVYLLLNSGLSLGIKILGLFGLFLQSVFLLKNHIPQARYSKLEYVNERWVLWHANKNILTVNDFLARRKRTSRASVQVVHDRRRERFQQSQKFSHEEYTVYTQHRVLIDLGLFFILHLSDESTHQRLVIFFDQIKPENYRTLRILEAIN